MASQRIDLVVEPREKGKHHARQMRLKNRIPAVIYGAVRENLYVSIHENDVKKYRSKAFENALFNVEVNGQKFVTLIKDVQRHPVTHRPEHVDLLAIDLNKPIRIPLEIRIEGKPIGLAEGGLLTVVNRSLEVECLPTQIPDAIVADVSHLGVGDSLHVADLQLPEGIRILSSKDMTIAVVNLPEEETQTPAAETGTAAAAATGQTTPATSAASATKASASPKEGTKKG